jgi:hypothetical protein
MSGVILMSPQMKNGKVCKLSMEASLEVSAVLILWRMSSVFFSFPTPSICGLGFLVATASRAGSDVNMLSMVETV